MKLAFFTLNAYDMLSGGHHKAAAGGAQAQQILIARELAKKGHDVYFIEYDQPYKKSKKIDGIHIFTKPKPDNSAVSRGLTATYGTFKILNKLKPDICYRRVLDFEIILLAIYSSISKCKFVYSVAHDDELTANPHIFAHSKLKSTSMYHRMNRWALSRADAVIVQHEDQLELARKSLKTDVQMIYNSYPIRNTHPIEWDIPSPVVLWAAEFRKLKRAHMVPAIARLMPNVQFLMAGGPGDKKLYEDIRKSSKDLDNLKMLGHIPFEDIDRYFTAADIFLNTSKSEGFPNTFLQAWAAEIPVVSAEVNPHNLLSKKEIGLVGDGSVESVVHNLSYILENRATKEKIVKNAVQRLIDNHSVNAAVNQYEALFSGLVDGN